MNELPVVTPKEWYKSKLVWTGICSTVLGIAPIIAAFVKVISPEAALLVDAAVVLVTGIVTVVLRVWFTDLPIV